MLPERGSASPFIALGIPLTAMTKRIICAILERFSFPTAVVIMQKRRVTVYGKADSTSIARVGLTVQGLRPSSRLSRSILIVMAVVQYAVTEKDSAESITLMVFPPRFIVIKIRRTGDGFSTSSAGDCTRSMCYDVPSSELAPRTGRMVIQIILP